MEEYALQSKINYQVWVSVFDKVYSPLVLKSTNSSQVWEQVQRQVDNQLLYQIEEDLRNKT